MNEKRKEIIIKEINHWKKSRLLPEKYCDFLLTLYTEGNQETQDKKKGKGFLTIFKVFLPLVLLVSFLSIYFTNFSSALQIIAGLLAMMIIGYIAKRTKDDWLLLSYFYYFVVALLLYLITIKVIESVFMANTTYIAAATMIHCAIWLGIGIKRRIHFFTVGGGAGLVILLAMVL